MQKLKKIQDIIRKVQSGTASFSEKKTLLKFLEECSQQEQERFFDEVSASLWHNQPSVRENSKITQEEFASIVNTISIKNQKPAKYTYIWKYTAAAIVLMSFLFYGWYYFQKPALVENKVISWSSKTTSKGQKLKITLSDSTIIYLAGGSTLSWPDKFSKGSIREVKLSGEAFFEVKRDTSSPFIVQTKNLSTEVLGTSFNIYAYPDDIYHTISVRNGKVRVAKLVNNNKQILSDLTLGMVLSYNQSTAKYNIALNQDNATFNSWIENKLNFQNATLTDIIKKLSRYYNVKFIVKGNCLTDNYNFNASFENQPIRSIMDQLQIMSMGSIHYKINNDNSITIWREGCR